MMGKDLVNLKKSRSLFLHYHRN